VTDSDLELLGPGRLPAGAAGPGVLPGRPPAKT